LKYPIENFNRQIFGNLTFTQEENSGGLSRRDLSEANNIA